MCNPAAVGLFLFCLCGAVAQTRGGEMPWIQISADKAGFALAPSSHSFVPMGFNYFDQDQTGRQRLIEDYWNAEWPMVEAHFGQMRQLGGNVVRVHLQFGKFMAAPSMPDAAALDRLSKLLRLAERLGLYLDLTGLGCYHKKDVPAWYDALTEQGRWDAQAQFWRAVASRCANSPAVFCYDLMNEPVVPSDRRPDGDWLVPGFFAGNYFVQYVTLDPRGRSRPDIARRWVQQLAAAVRAVDQRHLITVGLLSTEWAHKGVSSGFAPDQVAASLDFVCVHLYPEAGKAGEALSTLKRFAVGKPLVVEETYPLRCSPQELDKFIERAGRSVAGWISFYFGVTPEELRRSERQRDAIMLQWLNLFQKRAESYAIP